MPDRIRNIFFMGKYRYHIMITVVACLLIAACIYFYHVSKIRSEISAEMIDEVMLSDRGNLVMAGRYAEAIALLSKSIEKGEPPVDKICDLIFLAKAKDRQRLYSGKTFYTAIAKDYQPPKELYQVRDLLKKQQMSAEARIKVRILIGDEFLEIGNGQEAKKDFSSALELVKEAPAAKRGVIEAEIKLLLAAAMLINREKESGFELLSEVNDFMDNNKFKDPEKEKLLRYRLADVYIFQAGMYKKAGLYEKAEEQIKKIISLYPEGSYRKLGCQVYLVDIYFRTGKEKEAISLLEKMAESTRKRIAGKATGNDLSLMGMILWVGIHNYRQIDKEKSNKILEIGEMFKKKKYEKGMAEIQKLLKEIKKEIYSKN